MNYEDENNHVNESTVFETESDFFDLDNDDFKFDTRTAETLDLADSCRET